jgi:hypothetical protein
MTYFIRDWREFQHFKDRRPPWIKLHRSLLDDLDWHELDASDAKSLVMLWLIASEDVKLLGKLPGTRELAFRLRITEPEVEQLLRRLSHWLERDHNEAISGRYRPDNAPLHQLRRSDTASEVQRRDREESESESESEAEAEIGADAPRAPESQGDALKPEKSQPSATPTASTPAHTSRPKAARGTRLPDGWEPDLAWAQAAGLTLAQAVTEAEKFRDYWTAAAGAKGVKADWPATWRNWCRNSHTYGGSREASRIGGKRSLAAAGIELAKQIATERAAEDAAERPAGYLR